MDLWSIAKYDLGLSLVEFEDLTPGEFHALCKRRNIHFKYERFAHAITASAIYNVNRTSSEAPLVQPIDFVCEEDPGEQHTKEIKRIIREVVGAAPQGTSPDKYQEIRKRTISSLNSQGRKDAEQLFDEVWPSLKPKEG